MITITLPEWVFLIWLAMTTINIYVGLKNIYMKKLLSKAYNNYARAKEYEKV